MSEAAPTTAMQPAKRNMPDPKEFKKPADLQRLKVLGHSIQGAVSDALPSFLRKNAPAMLRALYTECQKNPQLLNCTPESLFGATISAAQMGLMLGGALGQCYLIPFKGSVTLVPGYKGYIQLVNRSGQVGVINAFTVFDKDTFSYEYGTSPKIIHKAGDYPTFADVQARKSIAYYATCQTAQGPTFVVVTKAEAEHHRAKFALSQKGPWSTHFDAMAMKTCIIKLCKYLPMSAEMQSAIHHDEMLETDSPVDASFIFQSAVGEVIDAETEPKSKTEALRDKLEGVKTTTNGTPDLTTGVVNEAEYEAAQRREEQAKQHANTK